MKNLLTQALSEEGTADGTASAMRLAVLACLVIFFPGFTAMWIKVSWATSTLAPIPESVIWLLATLLGAKTGQKIIEVAGQVLAAKTPPG